MIRRRLPATATLLVVLGWGAMSAADAEERRPFRTRNLSPVISIFGVPVWEPSADEPLRVGITSELANHYRFSSRGSETLILDGETWRTGFWLRYRFAERWSLGVEVPYYRQSGGVLDDVIDAWHSAFNLPDGGRNRRPEGQLEFAMADRRGVFYALDESTGGAGDILVGIGRAFGADTHLQATVKLPTGDKGILAGSGSVDLAVTMLRARSVTAWNRPAGFFWGVGGVWLGGPEQVRFDARRGGLLGVLGGSLKPWPRMGFKAQVEMHSALYDSRLKELGDPGAQVTLGGWRQLGTRGVIELGVNEDLAVSTSPDVVLHLNLSWTFAQ